jgi:hypothetical protein
MKDLAMWKILFLALALPVISAASPVQADDTSIKAGQAVIQQQITAFLNDDADAAYSFAAPAIKQKFPDRDLFFKMVQQGYQPVYKANNFAFGRSKETDDGATVFQEVLITGEDGKNWKALYQLERETDGSFKILGVQIVADHMTKGI